MDNFDNFQYDNASSYGGARSVVDDTSSVYTATTQDTVAESVDLSALSIGESTYSPHGTPHSHAQHLGRNGQAADDDLDSTLDEGKDEGIVDLPPHACR